MTASKEFRKALVRFSNRPAFRPFNLARSERTNCICLSHQRWHSNTYTPKSPLLLRDTPHQRAFTPTYSLRSYATISSVPSGYSSERVASSQSIIVRWPENPKGVVFPEIWLRDQCPCAECTHPQTKQRQFNTFKNMTENSDAKAIDEPDGLRINWSLDNHESYYPWTWLRTNVPYNTETTLEQERPRSWTQVPPSAGATAYPTVSYNSVMSSGSNDGLATYLSQIRHYGFSIVISTPPNPAATQSLLEKIAFIRPTHYGGFWDFTSAANPIDMAYTTLSLPAHTDTTYFTDPCGLQMFHLLSHTDGSGGESIFVDGLAAAHYLFRLDPEAYQLLSKVKVISHASGDPEVGGIDNAAALQGYPVFSHNMPFMKADVNLRRTPQWLSQVRWNNADRSVRTKFNRASSLKDWYRAAAIWDEILRMKEFELDLQMKPGEPVIFDNWRILHGRRAFTGKRRVCGGYINMDDFLAKYRLLNPAGDMFEARGLAPEVEALEKKIANEGEHQSAIKNRSGFSKELRILRVKSGRSHTVR